MLPEVIDDGDVLPDAAVCIRVGTQMPDTCCDRADFVNWNTWVGFSVNELAASVGEPIDDILGNELRKWFIRFADGWIKCGAELRSKYDDA